MNNLDNITLNNATLSSCMMHDGVLTNSSLMNPTITFSDIDTIHIGDEYFTGQELKDLLNVTKALKKHYPEVFI